MINYLLNYCVYPARLKVFHLKLLTEIVRPFKCTRPFIHVDFFVENWLVIHSPRESRYILIPNLLNYRIFVLKRVDKPLEHSKLNHRVPLDKLDKILLLKILYEHWVFLLGNRRFIPRNVRLFFEIFPFKLVFKNRIN